MKLKCLRLSNFQSFGPEPTELVMEMMTYLIGPNGSGKTAALQGLCRMFGFDPAMRRIQRADFHVPANEDAQPDERVLWIEADFEFPELAVGGDESAVPPHFAHMRLDTAEGAPRVRLRLSASMGPDGDVEESLVYVLDLAADGSPLSTAQVPRAERNHIQVHYLPARRDPSEHIAYGTNALLGRLLRAVNWDNERAAVSDLANQISDTLVSNPSIQTLTGSLAAAWATLHKGTYFADPKVSFIATEVEALLRHLSLSFSPGHADSLVDFSRLSDGQKSMLYLSLVLSSQAIGRKVLSGADTSFDPDKLRPPVFTLFALEEPENSLSPHYLGRIVTALNALAKQHDAQAILATHSPSILRRVPPERIRYLRLSAARTTRVKHIVLPSLASDAHKFVREAVQAFPEIYFSRLVVLGEGDSEEIILPRLLLAAGVPVDESAVTVAPLGGRHVNHFWRLLTALEIPHLTLLDLDVARHQAGWGRIKYVNDQLQEHAPARVLPAAMRIPAWNDPAARVLDYPLYFTELENRGVFFASPLDLDFAMLQAFPNEYDARLTLAADAPLNAVLGDSHFDAEQYTEAQLGLFSTYHKRFKLSSKPAAHIEALAKLTDAQLLGAMPASLARLVAAVQAQLAGSPE